MLPKANADYLVEELNLFRKTGRVCELNLKLASLKRDIEKLRQVDESLFHQLMSAYNTILGNYEKVNLFGTLCVNKHRDDEAILFATSSFVSSGFFSTAAAALSLLDMKNPSGLDKKISLSLMIFMVTNVMELSRTIMRSKISEANINKSFDLYKCANEILNKIDVTEQTILNMLDIAGEIMRKKGLLHIYELIITPDYYTESITLQIPLKIPADEVAEIEWEYAMTLFERIPNFPANNIFIGFSTVKNND